MTGQRLGCGEMVRSCGAASAGPVVVICRRATEATAAEAAAAEATATEATAAEATVVVPPVVVPVEADTLAVGSTTVSPSVSPLRISVLEVPTRPTVTVLTVCTPLVSTVTVEIEPTVVMAALGSSSTPLAVWTMTLTSAVIPSFTPEGTLSKATVTG